MKQIEKLPELVFPKGTGIEDLSARLIKRNGLICMYERSDKVWEVFKVKTQKEYTLKGKKYPSHEVYPNNKNFGQSAWCFTNLDYANEKFDYMVEVSKRIGVGSVEDVGKSERNTTSA